MLIAVMNSEPELRERVTAAVRVGGRRWNIQIEGRIDVRLPEADAAGAWAQLARIERQQGLLSRDVLIVDLRLPDRLVVRTDPDSGPLADEASRGEITCCAAPPRTAKQEATATPEETPGTKPTHPT